MVATKKVRFAKALAKDIASSPHGPNVRRVYQQISQVTDNTAKLQGYKALADLPIRLLIVRELLKHNPIEALARDLFRLRRARRPVFHNGVKIGTIPDHAVRLEATKTALKEAHAGQEDDTGNNRTINFNFGVDVSRLERVVKQLASLSGMADATTVIDIPPDAT